MKSKFSLNFIQKNVLATGATLFFLLARRAEAESGSSNKLTNNTTDKSRAG